MLFYPYGASTILRFDTASQIVKQYISGVNVQRMIEREAEGGCYKEREEKREKEKMYSDTFQEAQVPSSMFKSSEFKLHSQHTQTSTIISIAIINP